MRSSLSTTKSPSLRPKPTWKASRPTCRPSRRRQHDARGSATCPPPSRRPSPTRPTRTVARAAYATAITQLNQAKIDLARTKVASPVNGYVTNLQLRVGNFAVKSTHNLSLVDTDSFWITGFFEETKLAGIHAG